jgi:hypothetical protein
MKSLTREQFKSLLEQGYVFTPAYLYEIDQAPKGTEFVKVQISKTMTKVYRNNGIRR